LIKFSANYSNSNNNFVIQNLRSQGKENNPAICVVKNILQRGLPTRMSEFLQTSLPDYVLEADIEFLPLIDKSDSIWINTIKGDKEHNDYPARDFFDTLVPKYLRKYSYVHNLIIPEVSFYEITGENNEDFENQQVDFYLPQCKLVIEIDGQQHKKDDTNRLNDDERVRYLNAHGVITVRIDTCDLRKENTKFKKKITEIINRCKAYDKDLKTYEYYFKNQSKYESLAIKNKLKATYLIRIQLLILSLLEHKYISLKDSKWNISIYDHESINSVESAIEDLLRWLKHACKLMNLDFDAPSIDIEYCNSSMQLLQSSRNIKIDFSLLKRWTDENVINENIIFVRTDYFDDLDYFEVSTADAAINYDIGLEDQNSNKDSLNFFLKNIFGYKDFVEGQLKIIVNILKGNDTIGLLPTGGGKSLCYQLAVLLQPCISFVVVPIKSLMYDQKDNLFKRHITRIAYISSDDDGETKEMIARNFSKGKYFFILISPERFQTKSFRHYLSQLNEEKTIAYAVIDEVHCLSEWGHDFRTSYLNLCKTITKYCPSVRFLGLSATASLNVLKDILVEFEIGKENVKTLLSYTRPELHFRVKKDLGGYKKVILKNLIEDLDKKKQVFKLDGEKSKCGLIFTVNVNGEFGCYGVYDKLKKDYPDAVYWYSGSRPKKCYYATNKEYEEYKSQIQKDFKDNKYPLLVATKAFGMGIDKPNIRYTIHYGVPGSLESLYQEAGRAGRDKEDAACYIIYSKEHLEKEIFDKLFDLNTTMEEIIEIVKETPKNNMNDVLRNFFLWIQNNKGVDYETRITSMIFDYFAVPQKSKLISSQKVSNLIGEPIKFQVIQKAVYRLSLLGIVEDWTVEIFGDYGALEVTFQDFNEKTVKEAFIAYVKKYDIEFHIYEKYRSKKYQKFYNIIDNINLGIYERYIRALIQWNYDNVIYHRRQSLKNLVELCEDYTLENEENFKKQIEKYFIFTEASFVFDYLVEEPLDYSKWLELFYDEKDEEKVFKSLGDLKDMNSSLQRFLESYRYNTALNYVSGILKLFLNDFENTDGRLRLIEALKDISTLAEECIEDIFINTVKLGALMDKDNQEKLSQVLCETFPDKALDTYKAFEDNSSLYYILSNSLEKLKKIGGSLL